MNQEGNMSPKEIPTIRFHVKEGTMGMKPGDGAHIFAYSLDEGRAKKLIEDITKAMEPLGWEKVEEVNDTTQATDTR